MKIITTFGDEKLLIKQNEKDFLYCCGTTLRVWCDGAVAERGAQGKGDN
jgi:hypothetical protein